MSHVGVARQSKSPVWVIFLGQTDGQIQLPFASLIPRQWSQGWDNGTSHAHSMGNRIDNWNHSNAIVCWLHVRCWNNAIVCWLHVRCWNNAIVCWLHVRCWNNAIVCWLHVRCWNNAIVCYKWVHVRCWNNESWVMYMVVWVEAALFALCSAVTYYPFMDLISFPDIQRFGHLEMRPHTCRLVAQQWCEGYWEWGQRSPTTSS